jgi:guanylate kinase
MNNIVVVSGPSGCGKSTLIHRLLKRHDDLNFSVSHTTRQRRQREIEGKDYYFVSEPQFVEMIRQESFAEWARVYAHYYGTTWEEIRAKSTGNRTLVLDIDTQGARQVKEKFPEALLIFIAPPSMKELERRLLHRERKVDENIKIRLQQARDELAEYKSYDYIIINDELDKAYAALSAVASAFRHAAFRQQEVVEKIIGRSP